MGISYGTVLAQTYAYNYPEHVAGLILDGVVDIHQPMGEYVEEDANITWNAFLKDVIKIFVVPNSIHDKVSRYLGKPSTGYYNCHPRTYAKQSIAIQRDGFLSLLRMLLVF